MVRFQSPNNEKVFSVFKRAQQRRLGPPIPPLNDHWEFLPEDKAA